MPNMGNLKVAVRRLGRRFSPWASAEALPLVSVVREFSEARRDEFLANGYDKKRPFFPHRIYHLLKAGPDALKLARRMCGVSDSNKLWEVVIYATSPAIDEFPEELFFDDELMWHQQQFGIVGHVAFASLAIDGTRLYGLNYVSDLIERQSRRRDDEIRIEKRFGGWHHLLLNAIMNFAAENKIREIYSPTSELVLEHTDPARTVQRELFERVYDRAVSERFRVIKQGKWWVIDVAANRENLISPAKRREAIEKKKIICVCHDIERGWGQRDADPAFAAMVNDMAPQHLEDMLGIEREMKIKATYHVVGCFLDEVRKEIEREGHGLAFHSYDHQGTSGQLARCRKVDDRIKGYRPPQSRITLELSDQNLCYWNFDWLASSIHSIGMRSPRLENRMVKIPIRFDDFDLYKGRMTYREWEQRALRIIRENDFVAFGLHDCYAQYWLPSYREFLEKIGPLGNLRTLNEVTHQVILGHSQ